MSEDSILVSKLNRSFSRGRNPSVTLLGGEIVKYDRMNKEIYMRTFMCCDSLLQNVEERNDVYFS